MIETADLEGRWVNTDVPARGIAKLRLEVVDGDLCVWVVGDDELEPTPRGPLAVDAVYAAAPDGRSAVAFTAAYELASGRVELHANLSKGLLIIAHLIRFQDGGRSNRFAREFFRRVAADT